MDCSGGGGCGGQGEGAVPIIHRVVKDLLVQTGDPTGTGHGGESALGGPFKTEVSPPPPLSYRDCSPYTAAWDRSP